MLLQLMWFQLYNKAEHKKMTFPALLANKEQTKKLQTKEIVK